MFLLLVLCYGEQVKSKPAVDEFPPRVGPGDRVVLFDGVCKLCNGWCNFLIEKDKKQLFKLCSVQSQAGQEILCWLEMPVDTFDTMVYLEGAKVYKKSDAFLRIIADIPGGWAYLAWLRVIPRPIRDWCYDRIALNRYRLFGKYEACVLPSPENLERFIEDKG